MVIAVLGATGKVGRAFVSLALAGGHQVRALARGSALRLPDGVQPVVGSALDATAVRHLVAGSDAVVSVLGHGKDSPRDLQAQAISLVIAAMKQEGIGRLVSVTGTGVPDRLDPPQPLPTRLETWLLEKASPGRVSDGIAQTALIRNSGLAWTVVRSPLMLGWPSGRFIDGYFSVSPFAWVGRKDVAAFLLACLDQESHLGEAPMIIHASAARTS